MRLESDPTVIYGGSGFDGNLRRRDLEDDANPYNTYRITALPPGPIANPGRASLRRWCEPAKSELPLLRVAQRRHARVLRGATAITSNAVNRHQRRSAAR